MASLTIDVINLLATKLVSKIFNVTVHLLAIRCISFCPPLVVICLSIAKYTRKDEICLSRRKHLGFGVVSRNINHFSRTSISDPQRLDCRNQ